MSWTVTCLYNSVPSDSGSFRGEDVVQVVALKLSGSKDRSTTPSFTISYKQTNRPAIVRFSPTYIIPTASVSDFEVWRTTAEPFKPIESSPSHAFSSIHEEATDNKQKSLITDFLRIKSKIKSKVHEMVESIKKIACHKQALKATDAPAGNVTRAQETVSPQPISSDRLLEAPPTEDEDEDEDLHDELDDSTGPMIESTNIVDQMPSSVGQHSAAHTRSLDGLTADLDLPYNYNGVPSAVVLKSFFLALLLLSFFVWIYVWIRDPRRRADRAARAEERRTKRLYRRAARYQKMKTWVWNIRMHYGLASKEALSMHEKRGRVSQQEEVLEDGMKDDIRALRNANRVVSSMTITGAEEEGRAGILFDEGGPSQRRSRSVRSISTLPGYESDVTQPPPYDERRRDSVTEFTSDSSVVSTSPRISRDGTNSDFDEKIEDINLGEGHTVDV